MSVTVLKNNYLSDRGFRSSNKAPAKNTGHKGMRAHDVCDTGAGGLPLMKLCITFHIHTLS